MEKPNLYGLKVKYRRFICSGCKCRWKEAQTNHTGEFYEECPACIVENPLALNSRWVYTDRADIYVLEGRGGIVPMTT